MAIAIDVKSCSWNSGRPLSIFTTRTRPLLSTFHLVNNEQQTMSLYADEDIDLYPSAGVGGSASAPTDPLQALTAALSEPAETRAQADALLGAGTRFEDHPDKLPDLLTKLLPMVVDGGDSLLRAWTLDMLALTVGRSGLQGNIKLEGMFMRPKSCDTEGC
jgi:hypothetical protein